MVDLIDSFNNQIDKKIYISNNDNLYDCFDSEELDRVSKELSYISEHLSEYKRYSDINDLKKDLLSDD